MQTLTELAAVRWQLMDTFIGGFIDTATDYKNLASIEEVEAQLAEATFDTVEEKRIGSKILLDGDSSCPHDWCDFKIKLFMRLQEFI